MAAAVARLPVLSGRRAAPAQTARVGRAFWAAVPLQVALQAGAALLALPSTDCPEAALAV